MTTRSVLRPINILPGVKSFVEATLTSSRHWWFADKIRFVGGRPQKIGGWDAVEGAVEGAVRSIWSGWMLGYLLYMIGSHKRLYLMIQGNLTNVTPFDDTPVAIADSLETLYGTLANNPFVTQDGSALVSVLDSEGGRLVAGDTVVVSGVSGTVNGIPDTDLNGTFVIIESFPGGYAIMVSTPANADGAGGGNTVVRAAGLVRVHDAAHGLAEGDRVRIEGAATFSGILDTEINQEFIIRNAEANTFDVMTGGSASAFDDDGGEGATVYYPPLPPGGENEVYAEGYGAGLYGAGLYGVSRESFSSRTLASIWFMDRYGDSVILTRGNGTGVYSFTGTISQSPQLVPGAPTAVNYAFVSDNTLVTLGADGVENRIKASDQGDITEWTGSQTNQVFVDDIEGAGRLLSHANTGRENLIFSENRTYGFRKIQRAAGVWEITLKDPGVGIIAPMARCVVNGVAYWMGQNNFYLWAGGKVEVIPSNDPERRESTIRDYVFGNLTNNQKSKIFCWHNPLFGEIWWHYPSETANEPDRVARLNLSDFSWVMDTMERLAAEAPTVMGAYPMLSSKNRLLWHETGNDANGQPMAFTLQSCDLTGEKDMNTLAALIPDSDQSGVLAVRVRTRQYPQAQTLQYDRTFNLPPGIKRVPFSLSGRVWNYTISGNDLGQAWRMGQWFEEVQKAGGQ